MHTTDMLCSSCTGRGGTIAVPPGSATTEVLCTEQQVGHDLMQRQVGPVLYRTVEHTDANRQIR